MYCKNCGAELKEGTEFCPNCGREIREKQNRRKSKSVFVIVSVICLLSVAVIFVMTRLLSDYVDDGEEHTARRGRGKGCTSSLYR